MQGLMQDRPLNMETILRRVERLFGHKKVLTAQFGGEELSSTWGEVCQRARRLAAALDTLGVSDQGRVGTVAWNTQRHVELYLGVPIARRILHTVNHRLFAEQIVYIVNDGADEVLFVDRSLISTVWPLVDQFVHVRWVVVMDDGADDPVPDDARVIDYEELLDRHPEPARSLEVVESTAASLCYTSGTTGNPKGVLYSHRSIVLHASLLLGVDNFAISERDVVMPIVPMFHVNAWGLPFAAMLAGSDLVLPGPLTAPQELAAQMSERRVTFSAAVATVWRGFEPILDGVDLPSLRMLVCGGGAVPPALSLAWQRATGVPLTNAWGMTETSPVVTCSRLGTHHGDLDASTQRSILGSPGPSLPLTEIRVVDDAGNECNPGIAGELQVSGNTVASNYFGSDPGVETLTADGWLRTGDVATIDKYGYLKIIDRTKDLVKSGGEWISSVELENVIMDHPGVYEAAVIAVAHERWGERPLACVVVAPGHEVSAADLREYLSDRIAKWWMPDSFLFVEKIPKTATGKYSKIDLRRDLDSQALRT